MEKLANIKQLEKRVGNIDKLIDKYSILKCDTDNIGLQKSCEFFLQSMIKKKLSIQEIIDNIYSSIITMSSEE